MSDPSYDDGCGSVPTRSGFVALLGYPNVGKSTLLNSLVGERLSIVTPRPQTTWWRVAGIRTEGPTQLVFLDTPGLLEGASLIDRALMAEAMGAFGDADVVVLVLDPTRPLEQRRREGLARLLTEGSAPVVPVVNKIDVAAPEAIAREQRWVENTMQVTAEGISAATGEGVDGLLHRLGALVPESPFLYPDDEIATAPVRFFIEEMVRETVFEHFHEEIPYSVFCRIGEFREEESRTYIQMDLFVERASQKGMLIGKRGEAIRELGTRARAKAEHFLGTQVYLDLWVKVLPRWRKKRGELRRMGLPVPKHDDDE